MSKIEDLLNRTVRENATIKRWVVVVGIVVGLCITVVSFSYIWYFADVDGYLHDNKQIINLYDFYDQKVGENETAVFFIGSSIVGRFIYPPEINRLVKKNYPNITAYNLVVSGDLPIERTLEIQKIIDAKPSMVIYGETFRSVARNPDPSSFFERTKLVYSRLNIRNDSLCLYTPEEKMYFSPLNDFEKMRYLMSAIQYKFTDHLSSINYSFDPYGGEKSRSSEMVTPRVIIDAEVNDPKFMVKNLYPVVTNESTRNSEALIYIVKTLHDAGIPVIILNMPLHPLYSEKITDESRVNFFNLLNETGAVSYDLERDYGENYFCDTMHATFDGAMNFSPRMADLIIEQVEKDVIHYT